jgi:hypothetical protein
MRSTLFHMNCYSVNLIIADYLLVT